MRLWAIAFRLVTCFACGVIAATVIAIVCSQVPPPATAPPALALGERVSSDRSVWEIDQWRMSREWDFRAARRAIAYWPGLGHPGPIASWMDPFLSNAGPLAQRTVLAFGWPLPAMAKAEDSQSWPGSGTGTTTRWAATPAWLPIRVPRPIPLRPVVWFLLADSGAYGLVAFALWLVVARLRRKYRKLAGSCAGCGYDLRGLADASPCPECGKPRSFSMLTSRSGCTSDTGNTPPGWRPRRP